MESAIENPIIEFTYGIDKKSALSLYDCFVPALKESPLVRKNDEKYIKCYMKK